MEIEREREGDVGGKIEAEEEFIHVGAVGKRLLRARLFDLLAHVLQPHLPRVDVH